MLNSNICVFYFLMSFGCWNAQFKHLRGDGTTYDPQSGKVCPYSKEGWDFGGHWAHFFDGDSLTEERARNIQWVFKDGDNQFDRFEGLDPVHTDWHAKVKLYEVNIYMQ